MMEKKTTENTYAIPDGRYLFEDDELVAETEAVGIPEYAALERMRKPKGGTDRQSNKRK